MVILSNNSNVFIQGEFSSKRNFLKIQKANYKIRELHLLSLKSKGIKTYSQFSRLIHEHIGFINGLDIYNYWEGISFKEEMNQYVSHVIFILETIKK